MAKSVYQILVELENAEEAKRGLETIGAAAGLSGAALLAFSTAAAKSAADYEFALAKVETVATKATGTMEEFDKRMAALSDQMGNSVSKAELASASYDVLSSGYTEINDVLGILEQSQKAAVGGFSEIGKVSDGVTTILNSYGDALLKGASATEKATKVTDVMIQTQNAGKITVDEYVRLIGQVAPTAAIAGVSLDELSAVIATTTANGLNASMSMAGLGQVINSINRPTQEAVVMAKKLGIEFNSQALQAKGLTGIIQSVTDAGGGNVETMAQLFGSIEALRVVSNLTGPNLEKLKANLEGMQNSAGLADKAFDKMSDTMNLKAQAALNKLSNTMVELGKGVMVAIEPAIDALGWLVDNFNKLPAPLQQAIGLFTVVGGVTLTTAGTIAFFATQIVSMVTMAKAAIPVLVSMGTSLLGAGTSAVASASGFSALNVALLPLSATILGVAAAVGALALAWVHWQNIQKEQQANDFAAALQMSQPLADMASRAVDKIRESGKALPEAEYQSMIQTLKSANDEYGSLNGIISALEKVQAKAKDGTLDATQATEASTVASKNKAESSKAVVKALEAELASINSTKEARLASLAEEVNAGLDRRSEIEKTRQIESEANTKAISEIRSKLAEGKLAGQELADAEASVVSFMKSEAQSLSDYRQKLAEIEENRQQALMDSAIDKAKLVQIQLGATDEAINQAGEQAKAKFLQRSIETARAVISSTKAGTVERAQAEADYYSKALELAQLNRDAQIRAQEEIKTARKNALAEELADLELINQARQASLELAKSSASTSLESLSGTGSFLDGTKALISEIAGFVQDESISAQARNQALGIAANLYGQLRAMGIDIQRASSAEQQLKEIINSIELEKLNIKRQELEIAKEIALIEAESQRAELQSQIAEAQAKLASGTLTEAEVSKASLEIEIANQKLVLLEKQLAAKQRSLDLQLLLNQAERDFQVIQNTAERINNNTGANQTQNPNQTQNQTNFQLEASQKAIKDALDLGFQRQIDSISAVQKASESTVGAIGKLEDSQKSNLVSVKGAIEASQAKSSTLVSETNTRLNQLNTTASSAGTTAQAQLRAQQDTNSALAQTNSLLNQNLELSRSNAALLRDLPSRVAASIPKPSPQPR
jgi:TP901 family phage tail tape measure protein